jgi:hypothetical protein
MATAEGKVTTARITEGMLILVTYSEAGYGPSQTKVKNAERLTVIKVEAAKVGRVTGRQITGVLDNGDTATITCGSSQTFWLAQPKPEAAPVATKRTAKVTPVEPPRSVVSPGSPAKGEKVIGAKAEKLADLARTLGWQTAVSIVGSYGATLTATRGEETLRLSWDNEVVKVKGWHEFPGGRKAVYNAKEASRALAQATPVVSRRQPARRAQAASNGRFNDGADRVTAVVRSLPFDPATASDQEVLGYIQPASTLAWVNSVSGLTESAVVYCRRSPDGKAKLPEAPLRSLRMENGTAGRRIVTFPSEDGGMRSVALDQLVSVR